MPRRHVYAQGQRLGSEHDADEPAHEQLLDGLLERRDQPCVVGCYAAAQPVQPLPVPQHVEVLGGDGRGALFHDRRDLVALPRLGQPQSGQHALADCCVTSHPAEDEHDAGQQTFAVEARDDVGAVRGPPAPGGAGISHPRCEVALQLRIHSRLVIGEQVEQPSPDEHVLPQWHRALLVDDDLRVAPNRDEPFPELLGVRHGRRERDQPHRLG